ncbi:MAG TPA: hypothetical protein VIC54_01160 [Terriglobales bacterium]|jgi:hypothetical protein
MAIQTDVLAESIEAALARLLAFEPGRLPVLSVYLDTRPDQHGRAPAPRWPTARSRNY